ncbi:MAG: MAPEG family protein [Pseudomonadota bacterium]
MDTAYIYLALSAALTLLLWTPYILARVFVWGLPTFLSNYPKNFPAEQPEPPLWAQRAQRAHLNMVETMPAFVGAVVAAGALANGDVNAAQSVGTWSAVFFYARVAHAVVYTLAVPAMRTPIYLVSWAAVLMIAKTALFA